MELLIVIGLLATLSALSAGAFFATQRSSGMVGAEQAMIDAVRQGRHLARTSGAPVLLSIAKNGDELTGAVQVPLWHLVPRQGRGLAAGPSGTAVWLNGISDPRSDLNPPTDVQNNLGLSRRDEIGWQHDDALILDLTIRTPKVPSGGTTVQQPLVIIGPENDISIDQSTMGISLTSQAMNVPGEASITVPTWTVYYWVRRQGQSPAILVRKWIQGLPGEQWEQLGLRVDDQSITLLHQGRVVERFPESGPLTAPTPPMHLHLGQIIDDPIIGAIYASGIAVANVRLSRLRQGVRQRFGGGITSTDDYRIECLPDGRILTSSGGGGPSRTGRITLTNRNSGLNTSITISANGMVTSTVAAP